VKEHFDSDISVLLQDKQRLQEQLEWEQQNGQILQGHLDESRRHCEQQTEESKALLDQKNIEVRRSIDTRSHYIGLIVGSLPTDAHRSAKQTSDCDRRFSPTDWPFRRRKRMATKRRTPGQCIVNRLFVVDRSFFGFRKKIRRNANKSNR
jgi:hypothetical protein